MFVRNRKPALSVETNSVSPRKLKHLFLTAMERAFRSGELPKRRHGWYRVYRAFIDMMGPDCALYPSHAAIAERAETSERTVWSAMNAIEDIGLVRVTPRYVYDREKGKTVRTSNLYEIVISKAHQALAVVAAAARKGAERTKREVRSVIHDLTATNTEKPQKNLFKSRNSVIQPPQMTPNEYREYVEQWTKGH